MPTPITSGCARRTPCRWSRDGYRLGVARGELPSPAGRGCSVAARRLALAHVVSATSADAAGLRPVGGAAARTRFGRPRESPPRGERDVRRASMPWNAFVRGPGGAVRIPPWQMLTLTHRRRTRRLPHPWRTTRLSPRCGRCRGQRPRSGQDACTSCRAVPSGPAPRSLRTRCSSSTIHGRPSNPVSAATAGRRSTSPRARASVRCGR